MSILTKILIVLVTIMSLVYLGISATLFSYRVNYKKLLSEKEEELRIVTEEAKEEIGRLRGEINTKNLRIEKLESDIQTMETDLRASKDDLHDWKTAHAEASKQLNALRIERDKLQADLEEQLKRNEKLQDRVDKHRRRKEEAEKDFNASVAELHETRDKLIKVEKHLSALEKEHYEMAKDNRYLKEEIAFYKERVPKLKVIGPAKPIEGKVLATSEKTGYNIVVISSGKDDGVETGMEFTVSRGKKYIGKIRVYKADREYSAATTIEEYMKDRVQIGDKVATSVY